MNNENKFRRFFLHVIEAFSNKYEFSFQTPGTLSFVGSVEFQEIHSLH